jgi:hypothetical protein
MSSTLKTPGFESRVLMDAKSFVICARRSLVELFFFVFCFTFLKNFGGPEF